MEQMFEKGWSLMANIDMDKMKAIESAMGQIEKQFGKGSIMKLGEHSSLNVDAISTGSLDLDIALGIGGVPRGRIIEIYGPERTNASVISNPCSPVSGWETIRFSVSTPTFLA